MNPQDLARYAEEFQRDGFVHVPGVLTADEIARYGPAVDEAVATRKRATPARSTRRHPTSSRSCSASTSGRIFPASAR